VISFLLSGLHIQPRELQNLVQFGVELNNWESRLKNAYAALQSIRICPGDRNARSGRRRFCNPWPTQQRTWVKTKSAGSSIQFENAQNLPHFGPLPQDFSRSQGGPFCLCANRGKSDFPVIMNRRKDFPRQLLKPPSYHRPNFRLSSKTMHLLLRRLVPHLLLHPPLPIRFAVQHQRHLPP
jgi:hypothetical protein